MFTSITRFLVLVVFTGCMLLSPTLKGQFRDAGLWTSVNLEVKLVKSLSATVSEELRLNENVTELGVAFTDLGLSYKLNKHFQISANYRFIQKHRSDNYYSFRHRYYVDVKYSRKLKPFELSFRSRLQDQYADIGRAADGGVPEYYLRNKLSMKWDTKKAYSPYVSMELFSPLNYPRSYLFNNIRIAAGAEYAFSKHHKIDLYYMNQKELNVKNPEADFIIGLGYFYKL